MTFLSAEGNEEFVLHQCTINVLQQNIIEHSAPVNSTTGNSINLLNWTFSSGHAVLTSDVKVTLNLTPAQFD